MSVRTPTRAATLVAAASRTLALAGLFDMHAHVSVRDGEFAFVNPRGASPISIRPEEVAVVRIVDGDEVEHVPPSEIQLHLEFYRARHDVGAVAHFHPLYATTFAVAGKPLLTAFNAGTWFGREVPVYDDPLLVRDDAQGRRLAEVLGAGRAALLRGHGVVVVGHDIPACVATSLALEESARRLWLAYAIGEPKRFTEDEVSRVAEQTLEPRVFRRIWIEALERARIAGALDDIDPETLS
jgi:HCOMODA/2-hydroxy-3-carboxy-muconic semialdehyde decarboxylase